MERTQYNDLIISTLNNFFNGEDRKRIINKLKGQKIIFTRNTNNKDEDSLDCSGLDNLKTLEMSLKNKEISLKIIEDYEYEKPYKYSVLFEYDNLNQTIINNLIAQNDAILYNENQSNDSIQNVISIPTIKADGDKILFKFSLIRRSDRQGEENVNVKYTILVIFFTSNNILEVRLDILKNKFKQNKEFYSNQVKAVKAWMERNLNIAIRDINCRGIIDNIIRNNSDEVKVYQQTIRTNALGKANLRVADDGRFVLPILGDLITLIEDNREEFEKEGCNVVYGLLKDFIREIEDTSDFPRVTLCWNKRSADFIVEFTHEFYGNSFSMLQHYGRSQDLEGMNYVAEYIIANREMD